MCRSWSGVGAYSAKAEAQSESKISDSAHLCCVSEVAGVTFSDSDSAPVPKFLNPGPESASGNFSNLGI